MAAEGDLRWTTSLIHLDRADQNGVRERKTGCLCRHETYSEMYSDALLHLARKTYARCDVVEVSRHPRVMIICGVSAAERLQGD
jgi:hypothetical protein